MIAGLILAGGQGTRLGGVDKAFVALNGRPLIAHVLPRLAAQTDILAISANGDPARFADYAVPVLPDAREHAGKGPLAGIAAGLAWAAAAGAEAVLSMPVDTPFFPPNFSALLTPPPAVAVYEGRQHHLAALWPVTFLPRLLRFLAEPGSYRVRDALGLCEARQVVCHGPADPFLNINTDAELRGVQSR
jgi:molybdopterin-guanine dinucleotide biosynthesis protein A